MKTALISGISGQDGFFLTEFLLAQGYEVHGIIRPTSAPRQENPAHQNVRLHYGDVTDAAGIRNIIERVGPDEIYNLAAQSHVGLSFSQPWWTVQATAVGALNFLEAIRQIGLPAKFYQASSSEMFGNQSYPQAESTPFQPRSPYACAKAYAHWQTVNYRDAYGLFACCGILFNHESARRSEQFVTRKITRALTRIKLGLQSKLYLGDVDAQRDWGYAGDYVKAMWMMLQQDSPDDYVIATGKIHSVEEFALEALKRLGLAWDDCIEIDQSLMRPTEVYALCGDTYKAQLHLRWWPTVGFEDLIQRMLDHDMALAQSELEAKELAC